jgi:predicted esterase
LVQLTIVSWFASTTAAQDSPWDGLWISSKGLIELTQTGTQVSGKFGEDGTFDGSIDGNELKFEFKRGRESGTGSASISESGRQFSADVNSNFSQYKLVANKKNENAEDAETMDFSGLWLSSMGTLKLEQDGTEVTGSIGPEGWSSVNNGEVIGTRLEFDYVVRNFKGKAWLEQTEDGKSLFGLMDPEKKKPIAWTGIKPYGYEMEVKPKPNEIVKGVAKNGMLYNLRMPDGWKDGDPTDVIILLHGSNWTTDGMVHITAKNWPDIGKKFAILGIQGQSWNKNSTPESPRFNYTYVNWVGRSTLGGFPYTHRESPYLVGELIDEFKEQFSFERVFVGGHSQGGYLTHVIHMHMPEKISGTFPMAGGVIVQAEPDVFDDDDLMKSQRETPMYLLHGRKDNVVDPGMSDRAYNRFLAFDFPRVKYDRPSRGHAYDFLPIDKAIHWLDMMTTKDTEALAKFGKELVESKKWRDVGIVIDRAKAIDGGEKFSAIWMAYENAARKDGDRLKRQIEENKNSRWVDKYIDWVEQFSLSTKCKETVEAFNALQATHQEDAEKLYKEGREAFRNNNRAEGYAKYQKIVDEFYASTYYRSLKNTLDKRK